MEHIELDDLENVVGGTDLERQPIMREDLYDEEKCGLIFEASHTCRRCKNYNLSINSDQIMTMECLKGRFQTIITIQ